MKIMKALLVVLIALTLIMVIGCGKKEEPVPQTSEPQTTETTTQPTGEAVTDTTAVTPEADTAAAGGN